MRQRNPNVSPGLEEIVLKCMAKSPGRRYRDGLALRRALAALKADNEAPPEERAGVLEGLRVQLLGAPGRRSTR